EDDGAHVVVAGDVLQTVAQLRQRLDVERVERLLPVDGEDCDCRIAADVDQLTGTFPLRKSTISLVAAQGPNTSATPRCFSPPALVVLCSSESCRGIVPPTTTSTSSAPFSFIPSRMRGTSVMCAPERIEIPTASASSWIAVSTICSGVWWRPV